jgi:hypothetical protein
MLMLGTKEAIRAIIITNTVLTAKNVTHWQQDHD